MNQHLWLAGRFNAVLARKYHTRLVGGAEEPLYLPASGRRPALIRYTRDYAQSVLHELAHWCVAGAERRQLPDYGYWYAPPPRSAAQQAAFFRVEERVQALELLLAQACGLRFHISADDFGTDSASRDAFAEQVRQRAAAWQRRGLRGRAAEVRSVLQRVPANSAYGEQWHAGTG